MASKRVELAKRVLETLNAGETVVVADALQLRNWADTPEDSLLTLREIAERLIASQGLNKRTAD